MLTPTELMVYKIINHIHLKTKRDDNLMKFIMLLMRILLNAMIVLKESFTEIGEKVSLKSILSLWVKPSAIRWVLYLSTSPFMSYLVLNIHLQPMGFASFGNGMSSQTLFSCINLYFSFISLIYFWELQSCIACWKLMRLSSIIPLSSSCSYRKIMKSFTISFLLSLVNQHNSTSCGGCWVCSLGTIALT